MSDAKTAYFEQAIEWASAKSDAAVKANFEGFDKPKSFINQRTSEEVSPDISFTGRNGRTNYTVIAIKDDNSQKMITQWKLLAQMVTAQNGKFHILAPRGHKMFAQRIVEQYGIPGQIYSL